MAEPTIRIETDRGVTTLTLNRPDCLNAFNDVQYDAFRAALSAARKDDTVRVVLVTGAGRAFSAGQDLSEMGRAREFGPFVDELATFDKPIVAAVNGLAVGIGFTMLLHCDVVYVANGARLRAPFVELGLVPEAGSSLLLPGSVGMQQAAEALYTSRWIEAGEAVELGLALRKEHPAELLERAGATAREIARSPLGALRETKRLLLAGRSDALREARAREDAAMMRRQTSPEIADAIRRFRSRKGRGSG